jgi:TPR repeat protein
MCLNKRGLGTGNISRDFEYKKAFDYFRSSAEQKNANSYLKIGDFHFEGRGTPIDLEKAAQFYQAASEMRNAQAMFNLGYMHQVIRGYFGGVEKK